MRNGGHQSDNGRGPDPSGLSQGAMGGHQEQLWGRRSLPWRTAVPVQLGRLGSQGRGSAEPKGEGPTLHMWRYIYIYVYLDLSVFIIFISH